jgi:hypothetical protein
MEPRYKTKEFLQRSLELYYAARVGTRATTRNGDDSSPIRPIASISGTRRVAPVDWSTDDRDINAR